MRPVRERIAAVGRAFALGSAAIFAGSVAQAQVGISSGLAQVVLVARSEPRGSIDSIGTPIERGNSGSTRELSVPVRVTSNTTYRLSVVRNDSRGSDWGNIWVRAEGGEFRSLQRGSTVLVARGTAESGRGDLNVLYRVDQVPGSGTMQAPPVRYELAINPQL
jgi:hypothetical protein